VGGGEVERDVRPVVKIVQFGELIGLLVLPSRVLIVGFPIVLLDLFDGRHRIGRVTIPGRNASIFLHWLLVRDQAT